MERLDYNKDLIIDPDALDVELLDQASRFMRYAEVQAQAKADLDRAKENLDVLHAELYMSIHADPGKFGLLKATEGSIAAAIDIRDDWRTAQATVAQAKMDCDLASAAVKAFEMRKDCLQDLVRLGIASYFATPSTPRNLGEEADRAGLRKKAADVVKEAKGRQLIRRSE